MEWTSIKQQRKENAEKLIQLKKRKKPDDEDDDNITRAEGFHSSKKPKTSNPPKQESVRPKSLLELRVEALTSRQKLKEDEDDPIKKQQQLEEQEKDILDDNSLGGSVLKPVGERAKSENIHYEPLKSSWTPPRHVSQLSRAEVDDFLKKRHIMVEGDNPPNPCRRFIDFKLPEPILKGLKAKEIQKPTPIQMQGLPVALSGRDMIGIALTGSGKTLAFTMPLILYSLECELKLPIKSREGPFGIIVCPSRELARQTFDFIEHFTQHIAESSAYKHTRLSTLLCIGGIDSRLQTQQVYTRGLHMVVATPGRLLEMLRKKIFTLDSCRYLCLDEADRLIDRGFDEYIGNIVDFFKHQRQTLLFSATMPAKVRNFAQSSLVSPIIVNVGRAGQASLDVIQDVDYVKNEAKMLYLLEVLQKTPPPVLIFSQSKMEVDDIYEFLLLKKVEACAIHGSKDQEERDEAVLLFRQGQKDVLVATDVASKGLDFPNIAHVINFDMPKEIENYVHRIGRTGRNKKTGRATTFVNETSSRSVLMDLKQLLLEAKQKVPGFLSTKEYEEDEGTMVEIGGVKGCAYCGGLGHRVGNCPVRQADETKREQANSLGRADSGGGF